MKHGFVYIWFDRKRNRFYIGCHWGAEDDGYICSSSWMLKSFQNRPEDFKRKILARIETRKELFEEEAKWLALIKKEELGKRYYNLKNTKWAHWSTDREKTKTVGEKISEARKDYRCSEETKRKISAAMKGRSIGKGRKLSEEHKMKIFETKRRTGLSEEIRFKLGSGNRGKSRTEEVRLKISATNTGKKHSLESREKMLGNRNGSGNKGRKFTEETRLKMSLAHKGQIA